MQTKTFGRDATKSDICLDSRCVSRLHARVTALANGKFRVEDLRSTNGTFVNGVQATNTIISHTDVLFFGNEKVDLSRYFNVRVVAENKKKSRSKKLYDPALYTDDFNNLVAVYDEYVSEKNKINDRYQLKCNALRSAIILPALIVPYLLNKRSLLDEVPGGFITISSLGGLLGVWLIPKVIKVPEEDLAIAHASFQYRFICPNGTCEAKLSSLHWRVLQQDGKCPVCKTSFKK